MVCYRPFAGKNNFTSRLRISGLKFIFHWKSHFVILGKSLFKSFVALLISCAVANNEVSSANSIGLYWRPSVKSLIQIRNKRGPRIDPPRIPARTSLQDECWPFRATLVSATLWNQLKCSKEVHRFRFALIYEWDLYARTCQMSLKYLKTHHLLHSLDLTIDKYHVLPTKANQYKNLLA